MSNETELDLTSPEMQTDLTPEQIAAAGERKKYRDGGVYRLRNTTVSQDYSKAKLKNGETNADAKGSIWLQLELTPVHENGQIATKVAPLKYQRIFFYDRLNEKAMRAAGYSEEQIKAVLGMTLPDTYDSIRGFARAMFPEEFGESPKWNKEAKVWTFAGTVISEERAKAIQLEEKNVVIGVQKRIRSNPKIVQGKEAYWHVYYEKDKDGKIVSPWPKAAWPSLNQPRDKNGVPKPILNPDKDLD